MYNISHPGNNSPMIIFQHVIFASRRSIPSPRPPTRGEGLLMVFFLANRKALGGVTVSNPLQHQ
jgi:hypothetical protein